MEAGQASARSAANQRFLSNLNKDYFPCNPLSGKGVFPLPLPRSHDPGASGGLNPWITNARPWPDLRKTADEHNTQNTHVREIVNKTEFQL